MLAEANASWPCDGSTRLNREAIAATARCSWSRVSAHPSPHPNTFAIFAFFAAKFFYDLDRTILRSAVDHAVLDIDAFLRQDAINRRPNRRLAVVAGGYK